MFDSLAEKLQATLTDVRGRGTLTEDDISAAMREIRLALLEADVNFKVVKSFTNAVKEKALGADVIGKLNPGQQVVKIVSDELTELMGGAARDLSFSPRPPTVILMAGLQGSGKTTATGKLARYLREEHGSSVAVAACDVYRPAAVDQLIKVGAQAGADVYEQGTDRDPVKIAAWARDRAISEGKDVLIIDTSGRLHVDQELMAELANIKKATKPTDVLLVVDAMTGQDAVNVAEQFAEVVQFDGVVMTKLDGDARGGAALSVKAVTGKPIMYASTGEKLDQFERFHPDRMSQRILGMGDVMTLIEKTQAAYDDDQAAELERKIRKQEFGLDDFLDQMRQIRRLGPLQNILGMIPGMNKELRGDEGRRARVRPDPGDHPLDDPAGAPAPRADQGLAAAADRPRLGHQRAGGQAADQAVRPVAQGHAPARPGPDAGPRRAHAPGSLRQVLGVSLLGTLTSSSAYVSENEIDPRRQPEESDLACRRRRSALQARRSRDRDRRALQRPDEPLDDRARRGEDPRLAFPGRAAERHRSQAAPHPGHQLTPPMKELLEYLARGLVDSPDEVAVVEVSEDDGTTVLELSVGEDDYGNVIGRGGRTASALRTIVKTAAQREKRRVFVDIVDS